MGYWIGQLLLWAGFIAAAFVTVRREEIADDKWATIEWGWYVAAMAVGILGAILIRQSRKSDSLDSTRTESQFSTLEGSLRTLISQVGELRGMCLETAPSEMVKQIDNRCAEPFAEFADARNALVQRFGLQGFAEVMTDFASSERFVNRAWSASADGYMEEAANSLERAAVHLEMARQRMNDLADSNQDASLAIPISSIGDTNGSNDGGKGGDDDPPYFDGVY